MDDRYGGDVLAAGWREQGRVKVTTVPAERDLVVEVAGDGFVGAVTRIASGHVELEDRRGRIRLFPLGGGFLVDGRPVQLVPPPAAAPTGRTRTASGSFADPQARERRHPYTLGLLGCLPELDHPKAELATLKRDPAWLA